MLILFGVVLAGCEKEQIRIYTAQKDVPPPQVTESADPHQHRPATTQAVDRPKPQLSWKLPANWTEVTPGSMSLASFRISGANDQTAEVSVTQLTPLKGNDALLVNMFRNQVGLGPLSEEEAVKQITPVEVGGEAGNLFELSGKGTNQEPFQIVMVMVHHPEGTWFYRISGNPTLVDVQKPAFLQFLKSIQVKEGVPAPVEEPRAVESQYHWTVPPAWKATAPGSMQVARFNVPEKDGARADVFVSVFDSEAGGTLANVNRWRNQIGLSAVDETGLDALVGSLGSAHPNAIVVDMANGDKRLVGAMVPRDGRYWYYKLLGNTKVVAAEKESFLAFAKSKP